MALWHLLRCVFPHIHLRKTKDFHYRVSLLVSEIYNDNWIFTATIGDSRCSHCHSYAFFQALTHAAHTVSTVQSASDPFVWYPIPSISNNNPISCPTTNKYTLQSADPCKADTDIQKDRRMDHYLGYKTQSTSHSRFNIDIAFWNLELTWSFQTRKIHLVLTLPQFCCLSGLPTHLLYSAHTVLYFIVFYSTLLPYSLLPNSFFHILFFRISFLYL